MTATARGWAAEFVLLGAIWGSSFLFMRLALPDLGPIPTAALRVGIAAATLVPLVLLRGLGPLLARHWRHILWIGLLNSALPFVLFAVALTSISTGLSAVLNATVPLFGALVAWAWLRDPPGVSRGIGLAIGFAGVALLAWDKRGVPPPPGAIAPAWAMGACLAATLCYAVAASGSKRHLAALPPLVTAAGSLLAATVALALPAAWLWPAHGPGPRAWASVAVLGVVCTGLAYVLYFRLIAAAGPARALTVTFVVPVFAIAYGLLFLAETVTPWMLGCAVVIVAGTALSTGLLRLPLPGR